jgi:hypothetical protein
MRAHAAAADGISIMQLEIRLTHRGVPFAVSAGDEPGYYQIRFQVGDQTFRSKAETKLPEMAYGQKIENGRKRGQYPRSA